MHEYLPSTSPAISRGGHFAMRRLLVSTILLCLPTTIGCGDGSSRVEATVTVDYRGTGLPEGIARFQPRAGTTGPAAGPAEIRDGRLHVPKAVGPVPGEYTMVITVEPPDDKLARLAEGGARLETTGPRRWLVDVTIPETSPWNYALTLTDENEARSP
jgi:hypothetical protein